MDHSRDERNAERGHTEAELTSRSGPAKVEADQESGGVMYQVRNRASGRWPAVIARAAFQCSKTYRPRARQSGSAPRFEGD